MGDWTFQAVRTADDVTDLLRATRAEYARVAAVGKDVADARFQVWYVRSHHHRDWQLAQVPYLPASPNDTKAVTDVLDGSGTAAVTFLGQTDTYYVWWVEED